MPFIKNIGIQTSKTAAEAPPLIVTLSSTATGSSGYFTSSNGVLYTGASVNTPSNVTYFITASGGTQPYTIEWSSSIAYSSGYPSANNSSSFTLQTYAGEQDRWTVRVIDSSTPSTIGSASIDTIVFGDDPPSLNVSILGSDTPAFQSNDIYGSTTVPLRTIGAAIKYAIPSETIIYVASGTYAENPLYSKYVEISGSSSPGLGSGNYFIYDTTWNRTTSSLALSRPINGFTESSFGRIDVTTSGSIQRAIFDVSSSGTVTLQSGVHNVTSSIRINLNKTFSVNGTYVSTGSGTTVYDYTPATTLRMQTTSPLSSPNGWTPIFSAFTYGGNGGEMRLSNVSLQIPYLSGSFFRLESSTDINVWTEMVKFYTITSSVAYEILSQRTSTTAAQSNYTVGYFAGTLLRDQNIYGSDGSSTLLPRYILDGTFIGAGTGRVINGPYSLFPRGLGYPSTSLRDYDSFFDGSGIEASTSGSRIQRWYDVDSGGSLQNPGTTTTRPIRTWNEPSFNGSIHAIFDGVDEFIQRSRLVLNHGSVMGLCVFIPNSISQNRGVIHKWGNEKQGYSICMTGSNLALTVYSTGSDSGGAEVTGSVSILGGPLSVGTPYIAEMFFDSSSMNKRVGMALYGTSSLITSSYFTSTEFSMSRIGNPVLGAASNESMGGGTGNFRVVNYLDTTAGLSDPYNGRVALVVFDGSTTTSHTNKLRRSIYDWARYKYFPSSSFVSHSLFADT